MVEDNTNNPLEMPDLYKYLYIPEEGEEESNNPNNINGVYVDEETDKETSKERPKYNVSPWIDVNPEMQKEKIIIKQTGDEPEPPSPGPGPGPNFRRKKIDIDFQSIFTISNNVAEYHLFIESKVRCLCNLHISAVGDDSTYSIPIKDFYNLKENTKYEVINSTAQKVSLENQEINKLILRLNNKRKYSLKLEAYEI